jgi:hypothetical protein
MMKALSRRQAGRSSQRRRRACEMVVSAALAVERREDSALAAAVERRFEVLLVEGRRCRREGAGAGGEVPVLGIFTGREGVCRAGYGYQLSWLIVDVIDRFFAGEGGDGRRK